MAIGPKKLHFDLTNVGLRAQATASGLIQLCKELHRAGVLDDEAIGRIKTVVADEIALNAPRSVSLADYRRDIDERLDRLFAGEQRVGDASTLALSSAKDPG
jgi:hypothetical protein